jgi:hypothetical protein
MGWETDFLQKAVDTCTNLSGKIEDCPLFTIQDESKYGNCNIKMPDQIAKEKMTDGMTSLPGNVAIMAGPAYAKGAAPAQEGTTVAQPSSAQATSSMVIPSYSSGSKLPSGSPYVPGAVFAAKVTASPSAAAAAPPAEAPAAAAVESAVIAPLPTPAPAAPPAAATSVQTYFSTEYRTQGNVVNEILWVQKVETVTASQTTTVAAPKHKRHMHRAHGRSLHY